MFGYNDYECISNVFLAMEKGDGRVYSQVAIEGIVTKSFLRGVLSSPPNSKYVPGYRGGRISGGVPNIWPRFT